MRAPPADQAQAGAVAARLARLGARYGARLVTFNAAAQRQAAQMRDPTQGPAIGRVVKAQEHLDPANDHADPSETPKAKG